jgi:UDP-2,4-diacetamido-2,4,6-trideoxy-beta-L-altropyranose hydrolase
MDVQSIATREMNAISQPRIAFRTDASLQIGTGHVMRCLTLADALSEKGSRCTFICRPHSGHLMDMIAQRGHRAVALPSLATTTNRLPVDTAHAAWLGADWQTDAQQTREALGNECVDWLVVDHYALDHCWEQALRPLCQNLMVIDDLADRVHDCDVLLDQNLGRSAKDYSGLLKPHTTTCIGPQYALLRPEFALLRSQSLARRVQPQLKQLLITMGGVDKDNATGQVLQVLTDCHLPADLRIIVVMGPHAPCLAEVKQQAAQMPWPTQVLVGVDAMAQLMADSDLCIGAAGSTSWERCCMGLPTLLLVLAENQSTVATALESIGAAVALDVDQNLLQAFEKYTQRVAMAQLKSLTLAAAGVSDGLGVQRMLEAMRTEILHD